VPEQFISSVTVERVGGRDHVTVFVLGKCSGTLVVNAGQGAQLASAVRDGSGLDPVESWVVKDFNVLYRAADRLVQRMPSIVDETVQDELDWLGAQLARLAPAFEMTETIRKGGQTETFSPWLDRFLAARVEP